MALDTTTSWIAVFTGLTAMFAGMSFFIGWRLYQHHNVDTGRKNPILLRPGRGFDSLVDHRELSSDCLPAFDLSIFNRSVVSQRVRITDISTLSPRGAELMLFELSASYEIPPHSGGDVPLLVTRSDILTELVEAEKDSMRLLELLERVGRDYLVRITGETESGHRFSYTGRLRLGLGHIP